MWFFFPYYLTLYLFFRCLFLLHFLYKRFDRILLCSRFAFFSAGLHVAVDISHVPAHFNNNRGSNSNGDDDMSHALASIIYMGTDTSFVSTLRQMAQDWATVQATHTNDNAFRATVVITEQKNHVETCTRLRKKGVVCPLVVLESSRSPFASTSTSASRGSSPPSVEMVSADDPTVVWLTYEKKNVDKNTIRMLLRKAGQDIPSLALPPKRICQGFFNLRRLKEIGRGRFSTVTTVVVAKDDVDNDSTSNNTAATTTTTTTATTSQEIFALKEMFDPVQRSQQYDILTRLDFNNTSLVRFVGTYAESGSQTLHSMWEKMDMDLATHISENGGIPVMHLKPIIAAVSYLHRIGILHRNIAAEHVMIMSGANNEPLITSMKLGGMRCCKHVDLGRTRTHCGVSEYISPEAMLNRPYGLKADR